MQTAHDPAISSYYVNDDLYSNLVENFSDWQREELAIAAPEVRDRFRLLLEREARLRVGTRFQLAHVVAEARQALQSALAI